MEDSKSEYILEKQIDEYEELVKSFVRSWVEMQWGKRCPEYD